MPDEQKNLTSEMEECIQLLEEQGAVLLDHGRVGDQGFTLVFETPIEGTMNLSILHHQYNAQVNQLTPTDDGGVEVEMGVRTRSSFTI